MSAALDPEAAMDAEVAAAKPEGPQRKPGVRAVRPRDAATVVLVRRDGPEPAILMGRRARGHDFMPSKWVFPGGRIDRADFRVAPGAELRPEVADRLERTAPAARARALALTAVRETFEEVGLRLAVPAPARPAAGPWREFLGSGAAPNLAALTFIARAITPPAVGKRFDARFFMAEAEALMELEPVGSGELDEIAWHPVQACLELDLPTVTRFVIHQAAARIAEPAADKPIPFIRWSRVGRAMEYL